MTVAQVWFAILNSNLFFQQYFFARNKKNSTLLKEIVFQYRRHTLLYKFYNIKEIMQCRFHIGQSKHTGKIIFQNNFIF